MREVGVVLANIYWLVYLLHVLEIPGSNMGLVTGYPDGGFFVFSR